MVDRVVVALFRHGITEENKRSAYLGWNDSALCAETKAMATTNRYEVYFSSDLHRCVKTANLLFPHQDLNQLQELREMNFGLWEGKTYEDLKGNPLYRQWLTEPMSHRPPQGESFLDFTARVEAGWDKITRNVLLSDLHSCAVITHGGVMRSLLAKFAPVPKDFWNWQIHHDQGFELIFDRKALRRGERCTLLQEVPLMVKEHG